ncbi:MAG: hypothetical protein JSS37_06810 [Proteobacteria bacterium]|nr:hypothetical protein [Pseudomonadota bacterium]
MNNFNSLTLVLEEWFDKPLSAMPDEVRQRIEQDFSLIPWDDIDPDQRRSIALQLDYQRDPATKQDRQYWWDFFWSKEALEEQIAKWSAIATPTASDLAQKEIRLEELKKELAHMEQQGRLARGSYYPERKRCDGARGGASTAENPPIRYIAYPKAMKLLNERLDTTPEELAAWIFMEPRLGGIAAYTNANELNPPPLFNFGYSNGEENYLALLMFCWFNEDDIANFQPVERYITGQALIERWSKQPHIKPKDFIIAKICESRLQDIHPTFGLTSASSSEGIEFPPIESGLFNLSEVNDIEEEDFEIKPTTHGKGNETSPLIGSPEWRKQNAQAAANAKHDQPGGSRDKQRQIKQIWATGKYSNRDLCAEQECAALDMSFSAARNALKNTPDP